MKVSPRRSILKVVIAFIATYLILVGYKRLFSKWNQKYARRPHFSHEDATADLHREDTASVRELWEKNINGASSNAVIVREEEAFFENYQQGWKGLKLPSYSQWAAQIKASEAIVFSRFQENRLAKQRQCEKTMQNQVRTDFDKHAQRSWDYISDASVAIFRNKMNAFKNTKVVRKMTIVPRGYVITL